MNYINNTYKNARLITELNKNNSITQYNNYTDVMIDTNFDIIKDSVYWCSYDYNNMNNIIKLHNNDIFNNNIFKIKEKCLVITKWMSSYGHLLDSITLLYDFYIQHNLHNSNYKVLISIPSNEKNILEIANILFNDKLINLNEYDKKYNCIEFDEILLITNHTSNNYFLSFPNLSKTKIQDYFNDDIISSYDNIFISRPNNPLYNRRLLTNHNELETFFSNNNFKVIIPDYIDNKTLYNQIKHAKNIVITNGSALCTLIFINENTKIFCLNSASYLPAWRRKCKTADEVDSSLWKIDNFEKNIWKNTINKYNFTYIDSFDNIITEDQTKFIIDNLK